MFSTPSELELLPDSDLPASERHVVTDGIYVEEVGKRLREVNRCGTFIENENPQWATAEDATYISVQRFKILDPERFIAQPAPPPKLFYITWWRKLTKRLYRARYFL
jgi:hypothetical protein